MKHDMISEDNTWKTESDLRCLVEADDIRKDPKRMKACKEMAKEKMATMDAVASKE